MRRQTLSGLHPVGDLSGLRDDRLVAALQQGEAYIDADGAIAPMPKIGNLPRVLGPLRARSDGDVLRALKRGTARMVSRLDGFGRREWAVCPSIAGGSDFPTFPVSAKPVYQSAFELFGSYQAGASATSPSATVGVLVPLYLPAPFLLSRFWWWNGSSAGGTGGTSGHDVALCAYSAALGTTARLYSTAGGTNGTNVTGSGASAIQTAAPFEGSAQVLAPGAYLLGYSVGDVTANRVTAVTASVAALKALGAVQAATVATYGFADAPALAAFASWTTLPVYGIAQAAI